MGDPVALVVAESRYIAEDAVDLVVVDYEPLTALVDYRDAAASDELVHESSPGNLAGQLAGAAPEAIDEIAATAPHDVRETIYQQAYCAGPDRDARAGRGVVRGQR